MSIMDYGGFNASNQHCIIYSIYISSRTVLISSICLHDYLKTSIDINRFIHLKVSCDSLNKY